MKFLALTSLIILATSATEITDIDEKEEERKANEAYLNSDERKESFKAMDAKYESR